MSHDLVSGRVESRGNKIWGVIVKEIKQLAVIFLYLWVLFLLFDLYQLFILRQRGITFAPKGGFALLNALALGKVMLIVEDMNVARWVRKPALIYRILVEAFILTIAFLCFNVLEHLLIGYFEHKTIAQSMPMIGGGGLIGLVCVATIMFFSVLPFIICRYVNRELGEGRLKAMLFGTRLPG